MQFTPFPPRLDDEEEEEKKPEAAEKAPSHVVDKHLFEARTVLITGPINQDLARGAAARLLALAQVSAEPVTVILSSPGGHVESGDMIHDMIRFVGVPVNMVGTGWVASAGALIFVAVPRERRFCTPNTRFLLHQPSGGMGGPATDIGIQAREILKMRARLNAIFAAATGQPIEKIDRDTDRDYWMSPEEAVAYGLLGRVVASAADLRG
ncbi:MAG: ATP-dependent Clp protease proteolytic subunit [Rhodobacteraceae bacterium]|nr:ATP-dependent Clp protease proteolytic subunit [Paracoccaceae bacterium]